MHLKKTFNHIALLILFAVAFVTTACERRPLIEIENGLVMVNIPVNWSEYTGSDPNNMTVLIYPKDGGSPRVLVSDDTDQATTELAPGEYIIYVISNKMDDYDCYDFVLTPDLDLVLPDGTTVPQDCGVDKIVINVPVPEELVDSVSTGPANITTETLYPHNLLWTGQVEVNVNGHHFVDQLGGEFTGLASSYSHTRPMVTMPLNNWESNSSKKSFTTSFKTLGLPATRKATPEENTLKLTFTMTDGNTIQRDLLVGNIIQMDSASHVFSVKVATTVNQTTGGFSIDVEPWNEEINGY